MQYRKINSNRLATNKRVMLVPGVYFSMSISKETNSQILNHIIAFYYHLHIVLLSIFKGLAQILL